MPLRAGGSYSYALPRAGAGSAAGRLVLGKGVYLCYIVIRYISEFSMFFSLKKKNNPK